jgi:hypothetical protein
MIAYSPSPQNNLTSLNTPVFQNWGPISEGGLSNPFETHVYYAPLSGMPVPSVSVEFKILDVIGNPLYAQYTEFRMSSFSSFSNPTIPFIENESIIEIGCPVQGGSVEAITNNGLSYSFNPTFKNLDILPYGVQNLYIQRIMQGKTASGMWHKISTYDYFIYFHHLSDIFYYEPKQLYFQHIQGFTAETKTFTIHGSTWKIIGNPFFIIESATGGVTSATTTETNSGYTGEMQTLTGSGTATIEVTPSEYYNTIDPSSDAIVRTFAVFVGGPSFLQAAGLVYNLVTLFNGNVLVSEPDELRFRGVLGFAEPAAQYIFFKSTQPYTIQSSPWLTTQVISVTINGLIRTAIKVAPIENSNFNLGSYQGFVTISATVNGVPTTVSTTVFYDIEDFVTLPFTVGKKAFTLDHDFVNFSTVNANTYMQFDMECKVFDFFNGPQSTIVIPQKIALFQGKSSLNVGKTIHRIMKRFSQPNNNIEQYNFAAIKFKCQERKYSDNSLVREVQTDIIQFVAGLSYNNKDMTILDVNLKPNRVTVNSYVFLNICLKLYTGRIEVLRNGIFFKYIDLPIAISTVLTKKLTFSEFAPGDVISFRIDDNVQNHSIASPITSTSMIKQFKIYPLGDYSNQIIWENEYLLQSTIDFTGEYKIQTDIEFKSQKLFQQLVEVLEILDTEKTVKLTINTGWLLKSDVDTVESLMRTRRAWLERENDTINLRPISKTIINEDVKRELIDYTLEFEINKKYNEETYWL